MRARVYNAIHIEVEVVELFSIRIFLGRVDWDLLSVDIGRLVFDDRRNNLWVLFGQPSEES